MLFAGLLKRAYNNCNKRLTRIALPWFVPIGHGKIVSLGVGDGAWEVPVGFLQDKMICYCFGVGRDISFDIALTNKNAAVYSFDPTPGSIKFMESADYDRSKLHFYPIGVWERDEELRFYAPMNRAHANFSVANIHATGEYFTAQCKTVRNIMNELGHDHIDLLKLDIEGSWYEVLRSIIRDRIDVKVLCVEFDTPVNLRKAVRTARRLRAAGFDIISRRRDNYLFVRKATAE